MVLRILNDTRWRYPVYFGVTVGNENRIGLEDYLTMEGLAFRVNSHKSTMVDQKKMEENLMTDISDVAWSKEFVPSSFIENSPDGNIGWSREFQRGYLFRNLGNDKVYLNNSVIRLMQNYRSGYLQLAVVYYFDYQDLVDKGTARSEEIETARQKVLEVLDKMELNLPQETVPITTNDHLFQVGHLYSRIGEKEEFKTILEELKTRDNNTVSDNLKYGQAYIQELNDYDTAVGIFQQLYDEYNELEDFVRTKGLTKAGLTQNTMLIILMIQ